MFTNDGAIAYATSEISGEVKKVDMTTHEVVAVKKIADDKAKPKDVILNKDETKLYVAGGRPTRSSFWTRTRWISSRPFR